MVIADNFNFECMYYELSVASYTTLYTMQIPYIQILYSSKKWCTIRKSQKFDLTIILRYQLQKPLQPCIHSNGSLVQDLNPKWFCSSRLRFHLRFYLFPAPRPLHYLISNQRSSLDEKSLATYKSYSRRPSLHVTAKPRALFTSIGLLMWPPEDPAQQHRPDESARSQHQKKKEFEGQKLFYSVEILRGVRLIKETTSGSKFCNYRGSGLQIQIHSHPSFLRHFNHQ